MMDWGSNHRYPPGCLGSYGQHTCDFISDTTRWGWDYFALCKAVLRSNSLMFEACPGTVNGGRGRGRLKLVSKAWAETKWNIVTFCKIMGKIILFWYFNLHRNIFIWYVYFLYLYIHIYIYLQKYFFAVSWISHPFFSEACPVQCIEGQCKLCSCPEVTKIWMIREVCCSMAVSDKDPVEALLVVCIPSHSSHDAAKVCDGQQGHSWGKDRWLT